MIGALPFVLVLAPALEEVTYELRAPEIFIQGEPFVVRVRLQAPAGAPASAPAWSVTVAGIEFDGVALGSREGSGALTMLPGQVIDVSLDLGATITGNKSFSGRDFRLGLGAGAKKEPIRVHYLARAEMGIDFTKLPDAQLRDYDVVLETSHGPIWLQLWTDVAPRHARNFLDLAYSGFYDDTDFHRVIPGFMIQGGGEKPGRPAPRRVKNEFNDRRHLPGVLSMARLGVDTTDGEGNKVPAFDSATCEFFIVHRLSPHLDGQYTGFGRVVLGMPAVEAVVDSVKGRFDPRDSRTHKPSVRQTIVKAVVVKAPPRRPGDEEK